MYYQNVIEKKVLKHFLKKRTKNYTNYKTVKYLTKFSVKFKL